MVEVLICEDLSCDAQFCIGFSTGRVPEMLERMPVANINFYHSCCLDNVLPSAYHNEPIHKPYFKCLVLTVTIVFHLDRLPQRKQEA